MKYAAFRFLPLMAGILLASCQHGNQPDADAGPQVSKKTCLTFPDVTTFLPGWKKDNVLVAHIQSDPDGLNPIIGQSAIRSLILNYTQFSLMVTDQTLQKDVPELVKHDAEISKDGLRYTYELADEPAFDDGKQLGVNDVIFSYKVAKCPLINNPNLKGYLENISDIEPDQTNGRRFTLVMKKPYILNNYMASMVNIMEAHFFDPKGVLSHFSFKQMEDKDLEEKGGNDLKAWARDFNSPDKYGYDLSNMNGLGAYQVVSFDKGHSVTLEKKKHHWTAGLKNPSLQNTAFPDKIIFLVSSSDESTVLHIKQQDIDVSTFLNTIPLHDQLEPDSNFRRNYNYGYPSQNGISYLAMNMKPEVGRKKLFTDQKVRQAMALLTPVDLLNEKFIFGKGLRYASIISPFSPFVDSSLSLIPLDVEQAKKLLADAGWKDTDGDNVLDKMIDGEKVQFEFDLIYPNNNKIGEAVVKTISEYYLKAGIKVNQLKLDPAELQKRANNHDFDMLMLGWSSSYIPYDFNQIWSTQAWSSHGSNFTGFGDAHTDALIDSSRSTSDLKVYTHYSRELQQIIYHEQPLILLYSPPRKIVIHKRFGNAMMTFERPGVMLNNLRLLSPVQTTTDAN